MSTVFRTVIGCLLLLIAPLSIAQSYPERPIRVILPVPAGGSPDVVARMITPSMSELLGQQLVVDNRGGAGGRIGAELAARAAPDGYTLFMTSPGALLIVPHLAKNVPYNTLRDFAPIGLVVSGAFVLVTYPSAPFGTVKELISRAKAEPGKLNYGSGGNGTANHLAMELFKSMANVEITHIPYKGAPLTLIDLLAGRVSLTLNQIAPVLTLIKSGQLRALGVAGAKRSPLLPDVPTVSEAGVPRYESGSWLGLVAPANTPKRIIARLNDVMVKAVHKPEIWSALESRGADPVASSPEEFRARLHREWNLNAKIVKLSGARLD